jgi:hypothetical protein
MLAMHILHEVAELRAFCQKWPHEKRHNPLDPLCGAAYLESCNGRLAAPLLQPSFWAFPP